MATRRFFLEVLIGSIVSSCIDMKTGQARNPKILLRSSWQTVNIGDIAHTPGFLSLMERYLPNVETTLWPGDIGRGVEQKIRNRFPKVKIVSSETELKQAFKECDFFVRGSGAEVSSIPEINRWVRETSKGFGYYGITFDKHQSHMLEPDSPQKIQDKISILNQADFVFFRDSKSLKFAEKLGCSPKVMGFGPDAAFACDLRNDALADSFLEANGLHSGKYLCCIAKLRYAPYWLMKDNSSVNPDKQKINERFKEQDNAPLLKAVRRVIRETDLKVLLCPEDMSEMAVNKEMIYDRLNNSEKERVVWRSDFWHVGEAISTYSKSAGLFGLQMHSPIMCIGHGIPAILGGLAQQTTKRFMMEDIGLSEWLVDFDRPEGRDLFPETVIQMALNTEEFFQKAANARKFVENRQKETMAYLRESLR